MQFKNPELLYALIALVIPIIVHLFQLRRYKKEVFTNVRMLQNLQQQTRKSSKIKRWLLLCTRLLILTALIIAFAEPYIPSSNQQSKSEELIVILDQSFSMDAQGKEGSLFKRSIQELLENTPETQTFSLYTQEETFEQVDIKSIQKELQDLKTSSTPFNLNAILQRVHQFKPNQNKLIAIISDGTDFLSNEIELPITGSMYWIQPKIEKKYNASIDTVKLISTSENFHELEILISQYGTSENPLKIGVYEDNKEIAKSTLNKEEKKFSWKISLPKKEINGVVQIEDNALPYDNRYYFNINTPIKSRILAIGDTEKNSFLKKIYTDDEFDYMEFSTQNLPFDQVNNSDVIILNEIDNISQALQSTLKKFVADQGTLIIIPSSKTPLNSLNSFINSIGSAQLIENELTNRIVTKIAFEHPLYKDVFEKSVEDFQFPTFKYSYQIKTNYPSILSFDDGSTFLSNINQEQTIYLFSAPLNDENSNIKKSPLIVPTLYKMGIVQDSEKLSLNILDNNEVIVPIIPAQNELIHVTSKSHQWIPSQQRIKNGTRLQFDLLPTEAGHYTINYQDEDIQHLSFNYPRLESDITKADNFVLPKQIMSSDNIKDFFTTYDSLQSETNFWKWLLLFALLFLITEVLIQKFIR